MSTCGILVPYNETNIYEATEKEWFAKVMSKAAKEGLLEVGE